MRFTGKRRISAAGTAALAALLLCACARTRAVGAFVYDEKGAPIPGALVYVEAWKHPGPYDFAFGITGQDGKLTQDPPDLQWKFNARLAYAAFAPGKQPFGMIVYQHDVGPENIHICLIDTGKGESPMRTLGFPFPSQPALYARAASPRAAPVQQAFWEHVYRGVEDSGRLDPETRAKWEALKKIMATAPQ